LREINVYFLVETGVNVIKDFRPKMELEWLLRLKIAKFTQTFGENRQKSNYNIGSWSLCHIRVKNKTLLKKCFWGGVGVGRHLPTQMSFPFFSQFCTTLKVITS
jgi:hypothetical protein